MTIAIIILGLFPQFVLNTAKAPINSALKIIYNVPVVEANTDMEGGSHE